MIEEAGTRVHTAVERALPLTVMNELLNKIYSADVAYNGTEQNSKADWIVRSAMSGCWINDMTVRFEEGL